MTKQEYSKVVKEATEKRAKDLKDRGWIPAVGDFTVVNHMDENVDEKLENMEF